MSETKRRILVCGGRDYRDFEYLSMVLKAADPGVIIHGNAAGADQMAGSWAKRNAIPVEIYHADWKTHGAAAGPIRNMAMLLKSKPDLVIAFPGNVGTRDMCTIAEAHGVQVVRVPDYKA